jgi:predicted Ser/Thr protein kinase
MQVIGPYIVEAELARGGMGVVYVARHAQLGRRVALKQILGAVDEETWLRFELEAQAVARLRHENVVAIHDVGVHEGRPYQAMELIEGESLQDLLDRNGPLPPRRAVEMFEALARAVAHAHAQGILHRDLKPANVLVEAGSRPLLTDFGLARDLSAERERLTRTGQIIGTPAFMPPEQASGEISGMDERTDVYSLGATLYAALTGFPPFRGGSVINVLSAVLETPPRPPSGTRAEVDRDLDLIVLRCLAKDPGDRYPSAEALARDLGRYLAGESVDARLVTSGERLRRALVRNPRRALIVGVCALLLAVAAGAVVHQARQISPAPTSPSATPARSFKEWAQAPGSLRARLGELENLGALPPDVEGLRAALLGDHAQALETRPTRSPSGRLLRLWRAAFGLETRYAKRLVEARERTTQLSALPDEAACWLALARVRMCWSEPEKLRLISTQLEERFTEHTFLSGLILRTVARVVHEQAPEAWNLPPPDDPWSQHAAATLAVARPFWSKAFRGFSRAGLHRLEQIPPPPAPYPLLRLVVERAFARIEERLGATTPPKHKDEYDLRFSAHILLAAPQIKITGNVGGLWRKLQAWRRKDQANHGDKSSSRWWSAACGAVAARASAGVQEEIADFESTQSEGALRAWIPLFSACLGRRDAQTDLEGHQLFGDNLLKALRLVVPEPGSPRPWYRHFERSPLELGLELIRDRMRMAKKEGASLAANLLIARRLRILVALGRLDAARRELEALGGAKPKNHEHDSGYFSFLIPSLAGEHVKAGRRAAEFLRTDFERGRLSGRWAWNAGVVVWIAALATSDQDQSFLAQLREALKLAINKEHTSKRMGYGWPLRYVWLCVRTGESEGLREKMHRALGSFGAWAGLRADFQLREKVIGMLKPLVDADLETLRAKLPPVIELLDERRGRFRHEP